MLLHGKTFRAIGNSGHGSLNTETRMTFSEAGQEITAVYSGGTIRQGSVIARWNDESTLEMLYHCITTQGELKAGRALASFTDASMHLDWRWLTEDARPGTSDWVLEAG